MSFGPIDVSKLTDFRGSGVAGAKSGLRAELRLRSTFSFFKRPVPPRTVDENASGLRILSSAVKEFLKLLVDMLVLRLRPRFGLSALLNPNGLPAIALPGVPYVEYEKP
jgi:hypothetical protein